MLNTLKQIFGFGPKVDLAQLVKDGAIILDVRTPQEYKQGHIKSSQNIPLGNLAGSLSKLKKDKAVITCCASGMRSSQAKGILISNGFTEVHNGGGWMSLQSKIR